MLAQQLVDFCELFDKADAIRQEARLNANARAGHLSTTLCHLGNIATRVGRLVTFDPKTEQVVDDAQAAALVRRQYRDHWAAPTET